MKRLLLIISTLLPFVAGAQEGVKVTRIWDNDYSAFPSIEKFNGKYFIAGYPVTMDERVTDHEAFLGNIGRGYAGNLAENVTVTPQFVARENAYDFLGAAMFDGKVQATEAFVKVVKATS